MQSWSLLRYYRCSRVLPSGTDPAGRLSRDGLIDLTCGLRFSLWEPRAEKTCHCFRARMRKSIVRQRRFGEPSGAESGGRARSRVENAITAIISTTAAARECGPRL